MHFVSKYRVAIWLATIIFLLTLRIANLHLLGLFDYDAVSNYFNIAELSKGNFARFYHHVSPLFYLSWLPFYAIFPDFVILQYLFALLNIIVLCFFVVAFGNELKLPFHFQILIILIAGSSMIYAASARYFSIDSFSLIFLYVGILFFYNSDGKKLENVSHWFMGWLCMGASLAINYKHLYFILFFIVYFLWKWRKQIQISDFLKAVLTVSIVPLLMVILGAFNGLSFLSYPKYFLAHTVFREMNQYVALSSLRLDFWFYLLYVIYFEPGLLLFGVLTIFIIVKYRKKIILLLSTKPSIRYLALLCLPYILCISFLPKAPRAFLPIQVPLLLLLFYLCYHFLSKKIWLTISVITIILQVALFYREFYTQEDNGYKKMGHYIQQNNIDKIVITSGKGILPYLKGNTAYQLIFHQKEIKQLKAKGFNYLLVDNFYLVAHPNNFKDLNVSKSLISVKEGTLLNKMIFLEHAEYTGLGFWQTMNNFKKISNLNNQLYLVEL